MEVLQFGHHYKLDNFAKDGFQNLKLYQYGFEDRLDGLTIHDLIFIVLHRTEFLNNQKPCVESKDAICYLREALNLTRNILGKPSTYTPIIIDDGHEYQMNMTDGTSQTIRFIKRNAGKYIYEDEHNGLQTQELLRVIIYHLEFVFSHLLIDDMVELFYQMRCVLFLYEARAYRRKIEKVNRKKGDHTENQTSNSHRVLTYDDIPFSHHYIEGLKIGEDGHIITSLT